MQYGPLKWENDKGKPYSDSQGCFRLGESSNLEFCKERTLTSVFSVMENLKDFYSKKKPKPYTFFQVPDPQKSVCPLSSRNIFTIDSLKFCAKNRAESEGFVDIAIAIFSPKKWGSCLGDCKLILICLTSLNLTKMIQAERDALSLGLEFLNIQNVGCGLVSNFCGLTRNTVIKVRSEQYYKCLCIPSGSLQYALAELLK